MDETKLYQLAVRGALEMPNDPFQAVQDLKLSDLRASAPRGRRADRQRALMAELGPSLVLMDMMGLPPGKPSEDSPE